jgi:hypothetical protein
VGFLPKAPQVHWSKLPTAKHCNLLRSLTAGMAQMLAGENCRLHTGYWGCSKNPLKPNAAMMERRSIRNLKRLSPIQI